MIARSIYILLLPAILFLTTATATLAQEVFDEPDGKYTVTLPAGWIAVVNEDGLGRKDVNIVFRIRENGALKIRQVDNIDPQMDMMEYAKQDENAVVQYLPGYNKLSIEKFVTAPGKVGTLLAYDYKNSAGQPFTGRNYYLRGEDKKIYILRFTGRRNTLPSLRNQTDAIARSFKVK
ncbi:MAG: hypothetical protein J2P41_02820 [Blastocatellia bacterium]|nr:hypothetical protein [Blastocatellia bacterium]